MNEQNNSSEESIHNTISEPQSDDDVFENKFSKSNFLKRHEGLIEEGNSKTVARAWQ